MPANPSESTSDRRSNRFLDFWRMPGAAAVGIGVVSIPLILLSGDRGVLVALAALCLHPVLDVPRINGCASWWLGAMISAAGWFGLFIALPLTVNTMRPLDAGSLVFLLPVMLYAMALAISAVVRLEALLSGRSRESGPRATAVLVTIAIALFVGVPMTRDTVAGMRERATGNTPPNTFFQTDGHVLSATPDQVSVRFASAPTKSFRLSPETKFNFLGPGWRAPTTPAGPDWLKPGQRVGLEYAYREHVAWLSRVSIWIDRGCANDARWTAASQVQTSSSEPPSLIGTTWETWIGAEAAGNRNTFEFLEGYSLAYQDSAGARQTDAHWRQNGPVVTIELYDCYVRYEGRIEGDNIKGEFSDEQGARDTWTARRAAGAGSATKPN